MFASLSLLKEPKFRFRFPLFDLMIMHTANCAKVSDECDFLCKSSVLYVLQFARFDIKALVRILIGNFLQRFFKKIQKIGLRR